VITKIKTKTSFSKKKQLIKKTPPSIPIRKRKSKPISFLFLSNVDVVYIKVEAINM